MGPLNASALDALYKVYPETARLLQTTGIALLERLPSDAERHRWTDFIMSFVVTFTEEHERCMVDRVRTETFEALQPKR